MQFEYTEPTLQELCDWLNSKHASTTTGYYIHSGKLAYFNRVHIKNVEPINYETGDWHRYEHKQEMFANWVESGKLSIFDCEVHPTGGSSSGGEYSHLVILYLPENVSFKLPEGVKLRKINSQTLCYEWE